MPESAEPHTLVCKCISPQWSLRHTELSNANPRGEIPHSQPTMTTKVIMAQEAGRFHQKKKKKKKCSSPAQPTPHHYYFQPIILQHPTPYPHTKSPPSPYLLSMSPPLTT